MNTKNLIKEYSEQVELKTKQGIRLGYFIKNPEMLPISTKQAIFDDFYPTAISAFGQNKSLKFQKDVWDHLFNVFGLILLFNDGVKYVNDQSVERGIAFRSFSEYDSPFGQIIYTKATAVDPLMQGCGIYQAFTNIVKEGYKYAVSRTQNPVVVTALVRLFSNVAPITHEPTDEEKQVGAIVASSLSMGAKFNPNTLVGKGVYGEAITGTLPHIDNEIKRKLYKMIDPNNGDCVLCVCKC